MAGEGPDLLILDGLPADSYAEKGILEDLTDIVEPEKEKYFYNIISAYNGGGKIYKVPTAFSCRCSWETGRFWPQKIWIS